MLPETRYAKKGDVHIAYQVVGEGDLDLVLVSAWFSHVDARWEIPSFAHYLRRLSAFSRLISFDKQGIGLSDPVPLDRLRVIVHFNSADCHNRDDVLRLLAQRRSAATDKFINDLDRSGITETCCKSCRSSLK